MRLKKKNFGVCRTFFLRKASDIIETINFEFNSFYSGAFIPKNS